MSNSFLDWTSRVAIAGRIAEHRRPHYTDELTAPGDYHLSFAKVDAATKASGCGRSTSSESKDRAPRHRRCGSHHGSGTISAGKFVISGGNAT